MNRCPITYDPCGSNHYSAAGLRKLNPRLEEFKDLPYSAAEQRLEAVRRAKKMSIQGVQPKVSAILDVKKATFRIVDINGRYIIKPQHELFPQLPENESLTMRLAEMAGIETPLNGMVYSRDGSLSYFIRRFDRIGQKRKLAVEDFAQLAGKTRDTKYDFTIEKMIPLFDAYCTFPVIEKNNFFRRILFCFLTGNEDMHLKNFSLIIRNRKVELSPAYDLLNTTLAMGGAEEESALMLAGKRKEFSKRELIDYLGREKLQLTDPALEEVTTSLQKIIPKWLEMIEVSFLTEESKNHYRKLIAARAARIFT